MRILVSRAIMKFVPGWQSFTGDEPHPLDSRKEPPQGFTSVSAIAVILERLNDQSHAPSLPQHQFPLRFENAVRVNSLGKLTHSIKPSVMTLARRTARSSRSEEHTS